MGQETHNDVCMLLGGENVGVERRLHKLLVLVQNAQHAAASVYNVSPHPAGQPQFQACLQADMTIARHCMMIWIALLESTGISTRARPETCLAFS